MRMLLCLMAVLIGCSEDSAPLDQRRCDPPCPAGQTCDGVRCLCDGGKHIVDGACVDAQTCRSARCSRHGDCTEAGCTCDAGYQGERCNACADGYQDNDSDGVCKETCATLGYTCGDHGVCRDDSGEATCVCEVGYTANGGACVHTPLWCRLQSPTHLSGTPGMTATVRGRVFIAGLTDRTTDVDISAMTMGRLGYGPDGTDPATWTEWVNAGPTNPWDDPKNDEYLADLVFPPAGLYDYAFSFFFGGSTTYCDNNAGPGQDGSEDGYQADQAGSLNVVSGIHPQCEERGGACTHVNSHTEPCPAGFYNPFSGSLAMCPTGSIQICCMPKGGSGSPCENQQDCAVGACLNTSGYPTGGLCAMACEPSQPSCDPWATCLPVFFSAAMGMCMTSCESDTMCRSQWSCQPFSRSPFLPNSDTTNVCWQTGIKMSALGIGEVCQQDADCLSNRCRTDVRDGTLRCSASCSNSQSCLPGFDCQIIPGCPDDCGDCFLQ